MSDMAASSSRASGGREFSSTGWHREEGRNQAGLSNRESGVREFASSGWQRGGSRDGARADGRESGARQFSSSGWHRDDGRGSAGSGSRESGGREFSSSGGQREGGRDGFRSDARTSGARQFTSTGWHRDVARDPAVASGSFSDIVHRHGFDRHRFFDRNGAVSSVDGVFGFHHRFHRNRSFIFFGSVFFSPFCGCGPWFSSWGYPYGYPYWYPWGYYPYGWYPGYYGYSPLSQTYGWYDPLTYGGGVSGYAPTAATPVALAQSPATTVGLPYLLSCLGSGCVGSGNWLTLGLGIGIPPPFGVPFQSVAPLYWNWSNQLEWACGF
jgi:hypothetical protein